VAVLQRKQSSELCIGKLERACDRFRRDPQTARDLIEIRAYVSHPQRCRVGLRERVERVGAIHSGEP
jgi:hypothetical protein